MLSSEIAVFLGVEVILVFYERNTCNETDFLKYEQKGNVSRHMCVKLASN